MLFRSQKVEGRLHGKYTSWYGNGIKKSEGQFDNNNRTGIWSVWDSLGNLSVKRNYENNYVYQTLFSKAADDETIKLLNQPRYIPTYNSQGFYDRFNLDIKMIVLSSSHYRLILPEDNPILFKNNNLLNLIDKHVSNGNLPIYDGEYLIIPANLKNISKHKLIGFKLKEQYIYDSERNIGEMLIVSLCPIMIDFETKDTLDKYWLYFKELNPFLAQFDISEHKLPYQVKTMSDLFFYRYFYGMIVDKRDYYDKTIANMWTNPNLKKESDVFENEYIEIEHDLWISLAEELAKKNK